MRSERLRSLSASPHIPLAVPSRMRHVGVSPYRNRFGKQCNLSSGGKHEKVSFGHERPRGVGRLCIRPGGGGGLPLPGPAPMGTAGGDFFADREDYFRDLGVLQYGAVIDGQSDYELNTDIDVTFTMMGQTDTGLAFGASIDLDESDGNGNEGASTAFDGRTEGGEEIWVSGTFGTLTMGDTDGALDWALQDIGIGGTLGDLHTKHLGYTGNDFIDDFDDGSGGGQIARYDYSFGDFAFAVSVDINDMGGVPSGSYAIVRDDILSVGAKYSFSLPAARLGVGVGWQQRNDWYIWRATATTPIFAREAMRPPSRWTPSSTTDSAPS